MGLLDSVLGAVMGGGQQGGGSNPLLQIAMQMLMNQGGGAGGAAGGLGGLVSKLQQAGLGDQVASWVGTGQNMPVSGDQITAALGSGQIADIASKLGLGHGDVAGSLAKMLPDLINHVTPNGQVPQDHSAIQDALSAFLKR